MSLLKSLPIDIQNSMIESQTLKGVVCLATTLIESYQRFWNLKPRANELLGFIGRTPQAIIIDLNQDYALANERNTKHYEMATQVNQWLADAGHILRVPTTMPEGYSNDGSAFIYTEPVINGFDTIAEEESVIVVTVEEQPEPEVIPEPQPEQEIELQTES